MPRPRRVSNAGYAPAPAGSWRAAGNRFSSLLRPPSPPVQAYRRPVTVPIGNDGIAAPVTFAGGAAQAVVGPAGLGTTWAPDQANLYTSVGQLDPAAAALYVGPLPIQQYQVAASLQGGGAQVALGGVLLAPGWFIWVKWTGGTNGATGYLNVTGSKTALT